MVTMRCGERREWLPERVSRLYERESGLKKRECGNLRCDVRAECVEPWETKLPFCSVREGWDSHTCERVLNLMEPQAPRCVRPFLT